MRINHQKGVGLIEVLVALLLLAIGILGFIALQFRAVDATKEATDRIHAMNLARDLNEKIRVNNTTASIAIYKSNMASISLQSTVPTNCYTAFCTVEQKAAFDVNQTFLEAQRLGMTMSMQVCPKTLSLRQCIYIAWDKTDPTNNNATISGHIPCTTDQGDSFSYNNNSACIVMEAF